MANAQTPPSVTSALSSYAIRAEWKYSIVHPSNFSVIKAPEAHLNHIAKKIFSRDGSASNREINTYKLILKRILKNSASYMIESEKSMDLELGEVSTKRFVFRKYYIISIRDSIIPDSGMFSGSGDSTIDSDSSVGVKIRSRYLSEFSRFYYSKITNERATNYINIYSLSHLEYINMKEIPEEEASSSTASTPGADVVKPKSAISLLKKI
nr:TPA_asm: M [Cucurbita betacytorhabdovirus 1]